jgi:hypothetical protein
MATTYTLHDKKTGLAETIAKKFHLKSGDTF